MAIPYTLQIYKTYPLGCNDNNKHEYTPINSTIPIEIDKTWHDSLPEWISEKLHECFPDLILVNVTTPHNLIDKNDTFWKFYKWYYSIYDEKCYAHCIKNVYFIDLNDSQIEEFKQLCTTGILLGTEPNLESFTAFDEVFKIMKELLKNHRDTGLFIKTSQKSGKNDFKLYSSHTITDLFNNLTHSPEILRSIEKDSTKTLVLKPWNDTITEDTEYRVFVHGKKITAISQQKWYCTLKRLPYLDGFIEALNELMLKIPYNDAVLDVIYTVDGLELIEINPGCAWHSSGASMFKWEELEKIKLENSSVVPIRLAVI